MILIVKQEPLLQQEVICHCYTPNQAEFPQGNPFVLVGHVVLIWTLLSCLIFEVTKAFFLSLIFLQLLINTADVKYAALARYSHA